MSKLPNVLIFLQTTNIISSHAIYKIKLNEDLSLKLKARIAPYANEDSEKDVTKTDC